jgi:hypothetical protein
VILVIGGLAAGIALVVVFAMFFGNSSSQHLGHYQHMTLTIEGLKQTYSAGEDIDFTQIAKSYGSYCLICQIFHSPKMQSLDRKVLLNA